MTKISKAYSFFILGICLFFLLSFGIICFYPFSYFFFFLDYEKLFIEKLIFVFYFVFRSLVQLVKQHGEKRWAQIAQMLNGRVGKQCRERWHNHLRPDIKFNFSLTIRVFINVFLIKSQMRVLTCSMKCALLLKFLFSFSFCFHACTVHARTVYML